MGNHNTFFGRTINVLLVLVVMYLLIGLLEKADAAEPPVTQSSTVESVLLGAVTKPLHDHCMAQVEKPDLIETVRLGLTEATGVIAKKSEAIIYVYGMCLRDGGTVVMQSIMGDMEKRKVDL